MADLVLTNPATKAATSASTGLNSIWAYSFLSYQLMAELAKKAGVAPDVDEALIATQVAALLAGPLRDALVLEVATGATPEAIAEAVITRMVNGPIGA